MQQGSVAEEGEVAGGGGDGLDTTSRSVHGETEEDLLQGLLVDEGAAAVTGLEASAARAVATAVAPANAAGVRQGDVGGDYDTLMLDEGELVFMEDYEEAYEQGNSFKEPSDAGEASAASEEAAEGAAEVASACGNAEQALLARHSLYRLVLRSSALEAHFHVKVFMAYPLCPPVFVVTRLLDIRDARGGSSKGSVALTAVNEVLRLEQQVGYVRGLIVGTWCATPSNIICASCLHHVKALNKHANQRVKLHNLNVADL
jgi:hypothetical protein